MKYIIDAQLPKSICWIFNSRGLDAIHTDDLPDKARTTDDQIREISIREDRIKLRENKLQSAECKRAEFWNTFIKAA